MLVSRTETLTYICISQVAGENEVKAQIKLRFITPNDQPVVIIRSFLVRQLCLHADDPARSWRCSP